MRFTLERQLPRRCLVPDASLHHLAPARPFVASFSATSGASGAEHDRRPYQILSGLR
jgi:hypothetical protein